MHAGGVDQVSGFDPSSDVLDLRSLLSEANVNLNGSITGLSNYLTVTDQGPNALLSFDPTGHGGGSTIAVLLGLGSTVTGLNTLIADGSYLDRVSRFERTGERPSVGIPMNSADDSDVMSTTHFN